MKISTIMFIVAAIGFVAMLRSAESPASQPGYTSFYTGQIKAIGKGTLDLHVLRGHSGIVHPVNVDDKTQVVLLNGKAGQLSDLKVGQWIKVYWNPDASNPKQQRIVKIEPGMSPLAADRLADLEKKAAVLDVFLEFSIDTKGNREALNFPGPDAAGAYKEPFFVRLSKDEMGKLLRYLAVEGFLADAVEEPTKRTPMPPYGTLWVGELHQFLMWTPESFTRLDGLKTALPEKAAQRLDALLRKVREQTPVPAAQHGDATPQAVKHIDDLSSDDGKKRAAATAALFEMGKDALEPLKQAGAKQVSPFGTIQTRRIDIVYSLIEGLQANPAGGRAGYKSDSFGLHVAAACTQEEVAKLGEKYGFTISGAFQVDSVPSCYVRLAKGKPLDDVLKSLLSNEPQVLSASLNYFEQ